jgi:hypothetical protein
VILHQFCVELDKTPVQTRDLVKQTGCAKTVSRTLVYPGTNDLEIKWNTRVKERCWMAVSYHGKINVANVRVVKERHTSDVREFAFQVDTGVVTTHNILTENLEMEIISR